MEERWRIIPGYPEYEASSLGGLRNGHRIVRPIKSKGYVLGRVRANGVSVVRGVHRLVALAFFGDPGPGMHAAHKNGVRDDNRLENIMWATPQENASHRLLHGTCLQGERNPTSKLTDENVRFIFSNKSMPRDELARMFGVHPVTISSIQIGTSWHHITRIDMVEELRRSALINLNQKPQEQP